MLLVRAHTGAQNFQRQDPPAACRELYDKGLLEAPRRAVWLQVARLVRQAIAAKLHRGGRHWSKWLTASTRGWSSLVWRLAACAPHARPQRHRHASSLPTSLRKHSLRGCGIPLDVDGLEHLPADRAVVLAVNHASYVDALVLLAVLPSELHFAAKREFARVPLLGFVLRRLGTYFVERIDPARGIEDTGELVGAVGQGQTVVFFPEGTFSRVPGLAAFRLGAFAVSSAAGVPIVPIVLCGTRSLLREHRWLPIRLPVTVSVQAPVMPAGRDWSAAVRLRDQVRDIMLRRCGEPDLAR